MSTCGSKSGQGFTLVEVMVSLVIFLVASMGLLPLLMINLQVNHDNSLHARARRLVGKTMTELQVVDYDGLTMAPDEPSPEAEIEIQQQVERDTPALDQSRITVTALWQQQGRSHRYQLQSIRAAP
jgi:prepilin-type N-terminal cleavage/methylation domain-containing protein